MVRWPLVNKHQLPSIVPLLLSLPFFITRRFRGEDPSSIAARYQEMSSFPC